MAREDANPMLPSPGRWPVEALPSNVMWATPCGPSTTRDTRMSNPNVHCGLGRCTIALPTPFVPTELARAIGAIGAEMDAPFMSDVSVLALVLTSDLSSQRKSPRHLRQPPQRRRFHPLFVVQIQRCQSPVFDPVSATVSPPAKSWFTFTAVGLASSWQHLSF